MEKEDLKAVYENDLESYLKGLGVLDIVQEGRAKCKFSETVITLDNLHVIFPESRQIKFVCNNGFCIEKLNHYLRIKRFGE